MREGQLESRRFSGLEERRGRGRLTGQLERDVVNIGRVGVDELRRVFRDGGGAEVVGG